MSSWNTSITAAVVSLLSIASGPVLANSACLSEFQAGAQRAGLTTDQSGSGEVIAFSADRNKLAPLHAALGACLAKAYQKKVPLTKNGVTGFGYASRSDSGVITFCELPNVGKLGGRGAHQNDYTIWVKCG